MASRELDRRRRELGMSLEALARRSGVSIATIRRVVVEGNIESASFSTVGAIASALGLTVRFDSDTDPYAFREKQAEKKAREIVALVQGSAALEAQAVDESALYGMMSQTKCELIAGSGRRLWA